MKQKVFQFEAKFGMPRAIGAVDGTHIPIQRPTKISQDVLIKKFISILVQAVCHHSRIFMDINCPWPGSIHMQKHLLTQT